VFARRRVRPELAVGAGAYHVGALFTAAAPPPATRDAFWALALSGGAGVAAELVPNLEPFVHARLLAAPPHPAAPVAGGAGAGGATATGADPSLIVSVGVQRTF